MKKLIKLIALMLTASMLITGCSMLPIGKKEETSEAKTEESSEKSEKDEKEDSKSEEEEDKKQESAATVDIPALIAEMPNMEWGDTFSFGRWEQDSNEKNGAEPMGWVVLAKQPGRMLVVSDKVIARMPYLANPDVHHAIYTESDIRTWLRETFWPDAFTEEEKALVPETEIEFTYVDDYQRFYDTTVENVFLLSYDEANRYMASKSEESDIAIGAPTQVVIDTRVYVWNQDDDSIKSGVGYVLRDSGDSTYRAADVDGSGYTTNQYGEDVDDLCGVRPAMWIVYDADMYKAYMENGIVPEDEELNARLASLQVGDTIEMGQFDPTTRVAGNWRSIIWDVMDVQDGKALLLAQGVISYAPMNEGDEPCTWATAKLREDLNSDKSLNFIFTPEERAKICLTTVHSEGSEAWDKEGGDDVECYLFVPSVEEIKQWFPENAQQAAPEDASYWLRNPDFVENYMSYVYPGGGIGCAEADSYSGVRLEMWVDIDPNN